ncbi:MAG: Crp/Fnr family transcriptional regulator [Gemmatimonadales bacterium]
MPIDEVLRDVPLFSQLRDDDLTRLAKMAHTREYARNAVVLLQGDRVEALYVVLDGHVKLVVTGDDGREVIISTRGPGDFFGEMSLLDDLPQSTHAIAMEDSQLLVLQRNDFHTFLDRIPQITFGLLRAFCRRLRKADKRISSLTMQEVPQRVAHLLLELADENDGVRIPQQLTHQVMAQMVGSTRETVSRTMRELTSKGVVEVTREAVQLPERRRLPTGTAFTQATRRVIVVRNRAALEEAARG